MRLLTTAALALALSAGASAALADQQDNNNHDHGGQNGDNGGHQHGGNGNGNGGQKGGNGGGQPQYRHVQGQQFNGGGQGGGQGGPGGGQGGQGGQGGNGGQRHYQVEQFNGGQGGGGGGQGGGAGGQGGPNGQHQYRHVQRFEGQQGGGQPGGGQQGGGPGGNPQFREGGQRFVGQGGQGGQGGGPGPGNLGERGLQFHEHALRGRDEGRQWWRNGEFPHEERAFRRFRISPYVYPHGWYERTWFFGDFLPWGWFSSYYYLDWQDYGLPPPPIGCEWVREGHDALLVDVWTGEILSVYRFMFW